ncbi:ABC transporter permease [Streptomyces sp. LMG1-1-1.1]|uniref:ABC transporter permease n=1 Tax=Streptomyces sp. LMG1-1-1.1 TaxID=3135245 RepID=UPI003467D244
MSTPLLTVPVLHSEWIKIRSLRGTLAALVAVCVATAGIQMLTAALTGGAESGPIGDDPLLAAFYGANFGTIAAFAFGATAMSSEFHNGALRTSLTAVPSRARFYLSKIAMVGGLAFLSGEVGGLSAFVGGQAFMGRSALELGGEGTYRAILGCGLYLALMTLLAAGLAAVLRSATVVLSLLIPFVLLVPFVLGSASEGAARFLPDRAGQAVMRMESPDGLGPWTGIGVLALWALVSVAGGWLAVRRRDA